MPRPIRFIQTFAVVFRRRGSANPWRDWGGRDTFVAQCEKKEKLSVEFPNYEFQTRHQKLINEKGEAA